MVYFSSGSSNSGMFGSVMSDVGDFFGRGGKYFTHIDFEKEIDKFANEGK